MDTSWQKVPFQEDGEFSIIFNLPINLMDGDELKFAVKDGKFKSVKYRKTKKHPTILEPLSAIEQIKQKENGNVK